MKIRRATLVGHLQKIMCGGQVTEAVFKDGFATQALTPNQLLVVIAPPLAKVEPLEEEIGLADLATIVKAFGMASGEGNETIDVNVRVEDNRLVIDEEGRGLLRLMTASPRTIGTLIEDATVAKVKAKITAKKGIPLTRSLIEGIKNTYSGFKAAEIELFVGPKGGRVQVGNENGHLAEFPSKDLKASETYSLLFGEAFVDVLTQITDYSTAELLLSGPGGLVLVKDGRYQFYLSPQTKSADDEQPEAKPKAAKGKGKPKAKPVEEEEPVEEEVEA